MDLALVKKLLWKLKWYILVVPIVCGGITYYLISLKPKQYTSKAQLATGITDQEKVTLGENDNNWNVIGNKFANFLAFIDSKEIISMVSYKLLINDLIAQKPFRRPSQEEFAKAHFTKKEITDLLPIIKNKFDSLILLDKNIPVDKRILDLINLYDYDIKSLKKSLSSSRVLTSDFIKVEVKSENQYLSAFIANQYCQEVIRFNNYTEARRFGNSLSFFKDLMIKKKTELELKMDTLRKFKENSQLVDFEKQSTSKLDQISELERNRNEELKKISSLRSAIEEMKRKIGASGSTAGEDVLQNSRITSLQDKIQKLSQKYYSGNTSNKRLADSIQVLRDELENRIYLISKNTNNDFEEKSKQELITKKLNFEIELSMAQSNYGIIENLLRGLKGNISSIVSDEGGIAALEMEIEAAKQEYISIEDKYNQARNISLLSGGNLRQIEFGQPADEPESTHIMLFTLLSAFAGGIIVAGAGVGLAMVDQSIRTPERFEDFTGLKPLGFINRIGKKDINLQELVELFHRNEKQKSDFEQQLRGLRYELIKDKSKVVLFTSLNSGHGKSFTIFSLAYSLSQNGSRVLIIDTNFKNNSLSVLFDNFLFQNFMQKLDEGRLLSAENGQNEEGEFFPSKILYSNNDFVKRTGFDNIDIIGSANSEKSPFEIFNDRDFHKLIIALVQRYDFIFMEGSAMNDFSDSKELMEFVDKVVLVVSADYSISKIDRQSIKFLTSLGERMLGGVVNKVDKGDFK